ncbi:MAG: efflux RND transporter permease subunit [Bacteroidota bacterium]
MNGIKGLVEYFVKFPILANIIIAITLIAGIVSLMNTRKAYFPVRADRNLAIRVSYPGASPEEMEEGVTSKIEEAVYAIAGIDELTSNSSENSATVSIQTLDNYNIDEVYTEVKNAIDGISAFPAGAEKPVIYKVRRSTTATRMALIGDVDLKVLKNYAETIEKDLLSTGNISQVSSSGYPPLEISIEVTEETLRRYNFTLAEVAAAVRNNNRDLSAGSIKSTEEEILIRSRNKETDAEQIGEVVVRSNTDGSKILLRDIATIKEQFVDQPFKGLLNGKKAVLLNVNYLETEDLEAIAPVVNAYVKDFNASNDAVELIITRDYLQRLNERLELLTSNGVLGLVLVVVALGLFLSLRLSFWVAWGIPSSFLGMFIIGSFFGLTINSISLFGMILVIGILVDDGIVIAENIFSHFEKSKNPVQAAIKGTMEVLPAVFTSVTTTMVAFVPLLLLTGSFEFYRDMGIVVIFSLGFSLLEAFFVLPAHLASRKVLSVKKEDTRSYKVRKVLNKGIDYLRVNIYGSILRFTMEYRAIATAGIIAFVLIVAGLFMGGFIKNTYFPQLAFTRLSIDIAFKPGEGEEKVEAYLKRFDDAVWSVNDQLKKELGVDENIIQYTMTDVGQMSEDESGSHTGTVEVDYDELDKFGIDQFDLVSRITKEIGPVPEAEKFMVGGGRGRWGRPVSVFLMSKNYQELGEAKEFLKSELKNLAELKEISDNVPVGRREMLFDLKPEAYFLGLNTNDITSQMRQGFFGEEVQRFMKGTDELRVWVRYPKEDRKNIGQIEDVKIKTDAGQEFPLPQLAEYKIERGVSGIKHYNTQRAVTVEADLSDPYAEVPPILQKIEDEIIPKLKASYPSVDVTYGGQAKERSRAGEEIFLYFGGAFVIIIFLLMITFRSFGQAFLIISIIPLGWTCAVLGHWIEANISGRDLPVSLLSVWGMVALSGVIINDAVVFLSKFNSLVKDDGMTVYDAAYEAGLARFRPILLTSLTTVLGLYPLINETNFYSQFLVPMAISVAYGVLLGTVIILTFFPVMILMYNDMKRGIKWLWTGERPVREDVERALLDEIRLDEMEKGSKAA